MAQKPAKRPPPHLSPRAEGGEAAPSSRKTKGAAGDDDTVITALELPGAALTPAMQAYFDKCTEKLGFIPNVLKAYAFDMPSLRPSSPCTTTSCWRRRD